MTDLENEISQLIQTKREGGYWDFKQSWYEDKAELLLDIICMANNQEDRTAYIIIGIEDGSMKVLGVEDDESRIKLHDLSQFISAKHFAVYQPEIDLQKITLEGHEIDVIIIKNTNHTPYYLEVDFTDAKYHNKNPKGAKTVRQGQIYLRLNDRKAGTDCAAPYSCIEHLWKKRFGIQLSPLEKMHLYLTKPDEWDNSPGDETLKYYRYEPEYTIGYSFDDPENRDGYEYYFLDQMDNKPHWTIIQLKYHQTVLTEMNGNILDGGRHFSPTPLIDGVSLKEHITWDISYAYWIKGSLEYTVHEFFLDRHAHEAVLSDRRLMENVLLFNSEDEHKDFNCYIKRNWDSDKNLYSDGVIEPYLENIPGYRMEKFKEQLINIQILQKMLAQYRSELNKSMN